MTTDWTSEQILSCRGHHYSWKNAVLFASRRWVQEFDLLWRHGNLRSFRVWRFHSIYEVVFVSVSIAYFDGSEAFGKLTLRQLLRFKVVELQAERITLLLQVELLICCFRVLSGQGRRTVSHLVLQNEVTEPRYRWFDSLFRLAWLTARIRAQLGAASRRGMGDGPWRCIIPHRNRILALCPDLADFRPNDWWFIVRHSGDRSPLIFPFDQGRLGFKTCVDSSLLIKRNFVALEYTDWLVYVSLRADLGWRCSITLLLQQP